MQEVFWSSWHFYNAYAHPQWRKDPHLLRMQEVIWSSRTFEGTHDHPQQRKSIRFCPMSKVIWLSYIFEKTQWSEGPLLLRMWEVISSSRTFEEAHDHWSPTLSVAHWGETTQSFGQAGDLKRHKLINIGEKPHKCKQCDYVTAQIGYLRDHIKMHSTEKPNQCNWCEFSWITKKRSYPTSSHPQWREATSLLRVRELIQPSRNSEEAHPRSHWRKAIQLHKMWLRKCRILWSQKAYEEETCGKQ